MQFEPRHASRNQNAPGNAAGRLTARSDADLIQASKRCDRKRRRQAESPREASARDRRVAALLFAFKLR